MRPQVCVHFDQQITGGTRRARMELERVGADGLAINMVSASGARKYLTTKAGQTLPLVVLDKLFAPCKTPPMCGEETGPTRKNVLPDYARAALVAFLERRVRLQVLHGVRHLRRNARAKRAARVARRRARPCG